MKLRFPLILRSDRACRGRVSKGWIIDLGPEGGDNSGEVVAAGSREHVAEEPRSFTGGYLKRLLANTRNAHPEQGLSLANAMSKGRKMRQWEPAD